ncbi:MAG: hypothetical protein OXU20_17560 [Myxococcales bacterium]|nr:hypothetical protein [Myxococcales bacterium]
MRRLSDDDQAVASPRARESHAPSVLREIFPTLVCAMVLVAGAFLYGFYNLQQRWREAGVRSTQRDVQGFLDHGLAAQVDAMEIALDAIARDEDLLGRFADRRRGELLSASQGLFSRLSLQHNITHLYYTDLDRRCFLRVHTPARYGDLIDRTTTMSAASGGRSSHGLELGRLGTFTLRVVRPVRLGGKLLGYVELGQEIDRLLSTLERSLDVVLTPLLRKDQLVQSDWERHYRRAGRGTHWNRLSDHVVAGALPREPDGITALLRSHDPALYELGTSKSGEVFSYTSIPLDDVNGHEVGKLLISRNVTALEARFREALIFVLFVVAVLSFALLAFLRRTLGRLDSQLSSARHSLAQAKHQLEERVEVRTKQLVEQSARREAAEVQLRQAQKMETVGQLTGGIAHDFNNLLTVIIGNLDLLQMSAEEEGTRRLARDTIGAAEKAATLTQRLLAFSRRQVLQAKPIDSVALVESLIELLARALGETVHVRVQAEPGTWHCLADPGQLENALLNLAVNARDAMPDGGDLEIQLSNTRVEQTAGEGPAPGDYVVIRVRDTGVGMSSNWCSWSKTTRRSVHTLLRCYDRLAIAPSRQVPPGKLLTDWILSRSCRCCSLTWSCRGESRVSTWPGKSQGGDLVSRSCTHPGTLRT